MSSIRDGAAGLGIALMLAACAAESPAGVAPGGNAGGAAGASDDAAIVLREGAAPDRGLSPAPDTGSPPPDGGLPPPEPEPPPPDLDGAPVCKFIPNTAPRIDQVISADAPPVPAGGAIAAGTYFMTSYVYYGATPACTLYGIQATLALSPTSAQTGEVQETLKLHLSYAATNEERVTGTYKLTGTNLLMTFACTQGGGQSDSYTATPNEILLFPIRYEGCGTTVMVFTKQPSGDAQSGDAPAGDASSGDAQSGDVVPGDVRVGDAGRDGSG